MTLEQLAALPYNNLVFTLKSNDTRWLQLIPLMKNLCPDFEGWLSKQGLQRSPENASQYISEQYNKMFAERNKIAMDDSFEEVHKSTYRLGFHALLQKRYNEYRNKPFKGKLDIGHFVGVKSDSSIDTSKIKNHRIGEIRKVYKSSDGRIVSFILNNEDGESFPVPFENTYQIY